MSKAEQYKQMIEDVVSHPELADEDEWLMLRDVVARIERKLQAKMPIDAPETATSE